MCAKRIYLASSWRNPYQPEVLEALRSFGHAVYDFRFDSRSAPSGIDTSRLSVPMGVAEPPATAFSWSEMDPAWKDWTPAAYLQQLQTSPRAAQGYIGDYRAMEWADTCVLCLPCGNSAHIEAGFMKGRGKRLVIYWHRDETETRSKNNLAIVDEKTWKFEPDLMYLVADNLCIGLEELEACLRM